MQSNEQCCPFEAFIANLGKYNEGQLIGEWVRLPTTPETVQAVFQRIGVGCPSYEEYFIADYTFHVDGLYNKLGEYEDLDELNYLTAQIAELEPDELQVFQAAAIHGDNASSVKDLINLTKNLDGYTFCPDIHSEEDYGYYLIDECETLQVPEELKGYIDYEAYGRDVVIEESGEFTARGYISYNQGTFKEYYKGDSGTIPKEYRVMAQTGSTENCRNMRQEVPSQGVATPLEPENDGSRGYILCSGGEAQQEPPEERWPGMDANERALFQAVEQLWEHGGNLAALEPGLEPDW